jgi:ABC-type polysaccharide/polyol phosphate transport system ATPase subunit
MTTALDTRSADSNVVLSARDIVKSYGGVHALKGVNFDIRRGKVTTLFGENGAGKSTLMKILAGVETPTSGHIELVKRCARQRYLDHPSGVEPRAQPQCARQRLHGPRTAHRDGRQLRRRSAAGAGPDG